MDLASEGGWIINTSIPLTVIPISYERYIHGRAVGRSKHRRSAIKASSDASQFIFKTFGLWTTYIANNKLRKKIVKSIFDFNLKITYFSLIQ